MTHDGNEGSKSHTRFALNYQIISEMRFPVRFLQNGSQIGSAFSCVKRFVEGAQYVFCKL